MSDEVKWDRGHWTNGQLEYEIPWLNGQAHGIAKRWHENGQLHWETPYVNGQVHGIERWWREDGSLWSIEKWNQGQRLINLWFDPNLIPEDATMELDLITNEMSYE
jgi:hypothetical protein